MDSIINDSIVLNKKINSLLHNHNVHRKTLVLEIDSLSDDELDDLILSTIATPVEVDIAAASNFVSLKMDKESLESQLEYLTNYKRVVSV